MSGTGTAPGAVIDIAGLIRSGALAELRGQLSDLRPQEIAPAMEDLRPDEQVIAFRLLPRKLASGVFEYLRPPAQLALVKAMGQEDIAALLNQMAPDDRTMLFGELPANVTKHLLSLLTPEERSEAVTLLGYAPGTIGRLMTPHYIAVREHWSVQQVMEFVREHGQDSETLNVIYVVDETGCLIDDIRMREFLVVPLTKSVADLMDRRYVSLQATDDQESAVEVFRREDRTALPVTDTSGELIGIVTIDDVLDIAERAATRDMQQVGGSEALDEPYMDIAIGRMVKKRAGWLVVLFLGEMLTATAMGFFEKEIERAVVLALFVPLIISSGGNSGSQASTLVIRAMALGELRLTDWWRVVRRETLSGLMLGCVLGAIGFLRISLWSLFSTLYGPHWFLVATTVGLSLVAIVLWGTLMGSMLPLLLRRLGFDPATSSAPFVATLVDVTGLVIYFSVGLLVLKGTLL
jgi:magnesium transporter